MIARCACAPWPADASRTLLLAQTDRAVDASGALPRLHSLLVSHRGELIYEEFFNGRKADDLDNVKSVSKSIISALVGVAIGQGTIPDGVNATLDEYFGETVGPGESSGKAGITIENPLTMQAGLRPTINGNYGAWVLSDLWVQSALQQPLEDRPGTEMRYSTGNTHLLSAILTRATGQSTLDFAREGLAGPPGFRLSPWPRDPQGIYFGGNDMQPAPRQMLAFGALYLNGGRLGNRQVVPASRVQASLEPHALSPQGADRHYGYGWWMCTLMGHQAPHAWGHGGQFIMLVPDLDLLLVTTSTPDADAGAHAQANRAYQLLQHNMRSAERYAVPLDLRVDKIVTHRQP